MSGYFIPRIGAAGEALEGARSARRALMLCMERTVWSDERLDDRFGSIDQRFDRIEGELMALRAEIASLRRDMHMGFMVQTTALLGLAGVLVAHSL
jgi:hypothetical protein